MSVDVEHLPSPQNPATETEQEPSLTDVNVTIPKQITKRKIFTPMNIMILLAVVAVVGLGTYYVLNLSSDSKDMTNQIKESHDKMITYADSSKKEGSSSGSTSSKSSSNNNKPNPRSQPAGKDVIGSNGKMTSSGSPGDDEDENKDDNSEKKKNSLGSTTEPDSEEDSQEESEEESY
jgi:hypothetical protein